MLGKNKLSPEIQKLIMEYNHIMYYDNKSNFSS